MVTMYRIKRRANLRGMRTKHQFTCDVLKTIKDAVILVAMLLGLLYAYNWYSAEEGKVIAEQKQMHSESTWVSCLNHKGVFINGTLHLCTLADTGIKQGDSL